MIKVLSPADAVLAKLLYGTDDIVEIVKRKSVDKQIRAIGSVSSVELENLTPAQCRKLCTEANGFEYLDGYEHRVVAYTITDESVDRYGDIVRAKGVSLENYKKNPVVQFGHDYDALPVGLSIKAWYDKSNNRVRSWALFYDDRVDSSKRSDLVFRYIKAGGLRACSVGFVPFEVSQPTPEDRTKLGLGPFGVEYLKSDLLEYSPVPVPANPGCLTDSIKRSMHEQATKAVRSGLFTGEDAKVLKDFPLFEQDVLDVFIKELSSSETVAEDVPAEETVAPIVPEEPVETIIDGKQILDAINKLHESLSLDMKAVLSSMETLKQQQPATPVVPDEQQKDVKASLYAALGIG